MAPFVEPETRYFIHDNGGLPFRVCIISPTHVRVEEFAGCEDEDDENSADIYETLFDWDDITEIFIGKSPRNAMTEYSGGHGPRFDGNSILVRRGGNGSQGTEGPLRYVYIGSEIYEFEATSRITKFVSPVGNNDVPYPFAFDRNHHCYLFLEHVKVARIPLACRDSPYEWYYEVCKTLQKRHGKLKIGNETYDNHFSFASDWHQEYQRLQRLHSEDSPIFLIKRTKGVIEAPRPLSVEEFVAQRETFAREVLHAEGLPNFRLLQERH